MGSVTNPSFMPPPLRPRSSTVSNRKSATMGRSRSQTISQSQQKEEISVDLSTGYLKVGQDFYQITILIENQALQAPLDEAILQQIKTCVAEILKKEKDNYNFSDLDGVIIANESITKPGHQATHFKDEASKGLFTNITRLVDEKLRKKISPPATQQKGKSEVDEEHALISIESGPDKTNDEKNPLSPEPQSEITITVDPKMKAKPLNFAHAKKLGTAEPKRKTVTFKEEDKKPFWEKRKEKLEKTAEEVIDSTHKTLHPAKVPEPTTETMEGSLSATKLPFLERESPLAVLQLQGGSLEAELETKLKNLENIVANLRAENKLSIKNGEISFANKSFFDFGKSSENDTINDTITALSDQINALLNLSKTLKMDAAEFRLFRLRLDALMGNLESTSWFKKVTQRPSLANRFEEIKDNIVKLDSLSYLSHDEIFQRLSDPIFKRFQKNFLFTYRSAFQFPDPKQASLNFLKGLKEAYIQYNPEEGVMHLPGNTSYSQLELLKVCLEWVQNADIHRGDALLPEVQSEIFEITTMAKNQIDTPLADLGDKIEKALVNLKKPMASTQIVFTPKNNKYFLDPQTYIDIFVKEKSMLGISPNAAPEEFSEDLTTMMAAYFGAITQEDLNIAATNSEGKSAPSVEAFQEISSQLSNYVFSKIITAPDSERKATINFFIETSKFCLKNGDLNSAITILQQTADACSAYSDTDNWIKASKLLLSLISEADKANQSYNSVRRFAEKHDGKPYIPYLKAHIEHLNSKTTQSRDEHMQDLGEFYRLIADLQKNQIPIKSMNTNIHGALKNLSEISYGRDDVAFLLILTTQVLTKKTLNDFSNLNASLQNLLLPILKREFNKLPLGDQFLLFNTENLSPQVSEMMKSVLKQKIQGLTLKKLKEFENKNSGDPKIMALVKEFKEERKTLRKKEKVARSNIFGLVGIGVKKAESHPLPVVEQEIISANFIPSKKRTLAAGAVKTATLLKSKKAEQDAISDLRQFIKLNPSKKSKATISDIALSKNTIAVSLTSLSHLLGREYRYKSIKDKGLLHEICSKMEEISDPEQLLSWIKSAPNFSDLSNFLFNFIKQNQLGNSKEILKNPSVLIQKLKDEYGKIDRIFVNIYAQLIDPENEIEEWFSALPPEEKEKVVAFLKRYIEEQKISLPPNSLKNPGKVIKDLQEKLVKNFTGVDPILELIQPYLDAGPEAIENWYENLSAPEQKKVSDFLINFANQKEIVKYERKAEINEEKFQQEEIGMVSFLRKQLNENFSKFFDKGKKYEGFHKYLALSRATQLPGQQVELIGKFYNLGSADQCKTLSPRQQLEGFYHMGMGLTALHVNDIAHGDLSARNLLVRFKINQGSDETQVRFLLSDWGRALPLDKATGSANMKTTEGPIKWMAPENLKNGTSSKKGDIYSAGMTMIEIIGGDINALFDENISLGSLAKKIIADPSYAKKKFAEFANGRAINPLLIELINQCLSPNPEERPSEEEFTKKMQAIIKQCDDFNLSPWAKYNEVKVGLFNAEAI